MEGNIQKVRKALIIVYDWILKAGYVNGYPDTEQKRRQLYDMMTKALSEPERNCDVGTPEEQAKRFALHCDKHPRCKGCPCCGVIPFNKCEFVWAQMPYEEGGAK